MSFLKPFFIVVFFSVLAQAGPKLSFEELQEDLGYSEYYDFEDQLSEEEFGAIITYTLAEDSFYKEINNYLRNPNSSEHSREKREKMEAFVSNFDSAFKVFPSLPLSGARHLLRAVRKFNRS